MKATMLLCVVLLMTGSVQGANLSFEDAKSKADRDRETLSAEVIDGLTKARFEFTMSNIRICSGKDRGNHPVFTLVVKMGADGRVVQTWLDKETDYSRCTRDLLMQEFSFQSDSLPFYWYAEHSQIKSR